MVSSPLDAQDVQLPPTGAGWLRLGQQVIGSNAFFDSNEDIVPIRTNMLYTSSLSGEYGLSDRFSVTVNFHFFVRTTINNIQYNQSGEIEQGRALNSIGDSEIGLRARLFNVSNLTALGFVKLGLPLGTKSTIGTDSDLQTGDGEFNQLAGLQLLLAVANEKLFISGYCALNNRTENYSDEIRFGFSANYYSDKFTVMAKFNVLETLFNDTAPVSLNGIFSNHREFVSPGVEVMFRPFPCIGIFTSVDFYPSGRNTLAATDFSTGLELMIR
jgi:hypothetical protein